MSQSIEWQKSLGGTIDDNARASVFTSDGGCIIAGEAFSNNGNVSGNHGSDDYWVIDLDKNGNLLWQKCYGGTSVEWANSIKATNTNEYIIVGKTFSNDGDVTGNNGRADYWILIITQSGSIVWEKTYGGSESDIPHSIDILDNSDLAITGMSWSEDGDVTAHHGCKDYSDYWTVKLSLSTGVADIQPTKKLIKISFFLIQHMIL